MIVASILALLGSIPTSLCCSGMRPTPTPSPIPPSTAPTTVTYTTTTPPALDPCNCDFNLYDPNLCTPDTTCPNTGNEFTFQRVGGRCFAVCNCPDNARIAVRLTSGGISIRDILVPAFIAQYTVECINRVWTIKQRGGTAQPFDRIVCQIPRTTGRGEPFEKAEQYLQPAMVRPLADFNQEAAIVGAFETCTVCTSFATRGIEHHRCPDDFRCSNVEIKSKFIASSQCPYHTVECPESKMQVKLDTGAVMTTFTRNVLCNGEWTAVDDGHVTHRVVGMVCLTKALRSERNCTCWLPLPLQSCMDDSSCKQLAADVSPDGCIARVSCGEQHHMQIESKKKEGESDVREVATEGDVILTCSEGVWQLKSEESMISLSQDDVLSCRTMYTAQ